MIQFIISFLYLVVDIISHTIGLFAIFGGAAFFVLMAYDIFCPIGREQLFISDAWRKDKENLRWNRKK